MRRSPRGGAGRFLGRAAGSPRQRRRQCSALHRLHGLRRLRRSARRRHLRLTGRLPRRHGGRGGAAGGALRGDLRHRTGPPLRQAVRRHVPLPGRPGLPLRPLRAAPPPTHHRPDDGRRRGRHVPFSSRRRAHRGRRGRAPRRAGSAVDHAARQGDRRGGRAARRGDRGHRRRRPGSGWLPGQPRPPRSLPARLHGPHPAPRRGQRPGRRAPDGPSRRRRPHQHDHDPAAGDGRLGPRGGLHRRGQLGETLSRRGRPLRRAGGGTGGHRRPAGLLRLR